MFVMSPVFERVNDDALQPYLAEQLAPEDAWKGGQVPMRKIHAGADAQDDLRAVHASVQAHRHRRAGSDVNFFVLVPAFVTTELKTAFQIGFMIFIPFLVIDLVVASVLMSMGMMMLSPLIISLPFKIMLFVLVDGWALIIGTLASSFGGCAP